MQSTLQRERSLKKLHFCIANYQSTEDDKTALQKAQAELLEKIEVKYRRSCANQSYVFPRKFRQKDDYSFKPEVFNLRSQNDPAFLNSHDNQQQKENCEQRQKPKIKLGKVKNEKRVQTEHYDTSTAAIYEKQAFSKRETPFHPPLHEIPVSSQFLGKQGQERVKTDYSGSRENYQSNAIKIVDCEHFLTSSLERVGPGSRSKSKLNMLTKSYMNLKSSKLPQDFALSKQISGSIRINDYKLMPGCVNPSSRSKECVSNRDSSNAQFNHYGNRYAHVEREKCSAEKVSYRTVEKEGYSNGERRFTKVK